MSNNAGTGASAVCLLISLQLRLLEQAYNGLYLLSLVFMQAKESGFKAAFTRYATIKQRFGK